MSHQLNIYMTFVIYDYIVLQRMKHTQEMEAVSHFISERHPKCNLLSLLISQWSRQWVKKPVMTRLTFWQEKSSFIVSLPCLSLHAGYEGISLTKRTLFHATKNIFFPILSLASWDILSSCFSRPVGITSTIPFARNNHPDKTFWDNNKKMLCHTHPFVKHPS